MQHCATYVIAYSNLTLLQNVVKTYINGIYFYLARRVEHCGAIGSQNGAHMSEIKYFLKKKRDRPRGLVAGRRGRGSVTGCLINFIF